MCVVVRLFSPGWSSRASSDGKAKPPTLCDRAGAAIV